MFVLAYHWLGSLSPGEQGIAAGWGEMWLYDQGSLGLNWFHNMQEAPEMWTFLRKKYTSVCRSSLVAEHLATIHEVLNSLNSITIIIITGIIVK